MDRLFLDANVLFSAAYRSDTVNKHLTLAELEDAVDELSKTIWLARAVVAEVFKKAREAER